MFQWFVRCWRDDNDHNVEKVEEYTTDSTPEADYVASSYAFAEENAMVVAVFNAYVTVFAVVQTIIRL